MGIPGLFKLLKTKFPNSAISIPLQALKNKTVAIDASGIVSQSFLNQSKKLVIYSDEQIRNENTQRCRWS
jgi:hypothetical protein